MKVENMWNRISSMQDGSYKVLKVLNFASKQLPQGYWWKIAMDEFHRLYKLGYWKWPVESKQNG